MQDKRDKNKKTESTGETVYKAVKGTFYGLNIVLKVIGIVVAVILISAFVMIGKSCVSEISSFFGG